MQLSGDEEGASAVVLLPIGASECSWMKRIFPDDSANWSLVNATRIKQDRLMRLDSSPDDAQVIAQLIVRHGSLTREWSG